MKTVNMDGLCVSDLNAMEQAQLCGGNAIRATAKLLEILGIVEAVETFIEGFKEGLKDGYAEQQNKS